MTKRAMSCFAVLLLAVGACTEESGGGDDFTPTPCPADVQAGSSVNCYCPDNMALMGTAYCDQSRLLTSCDCSNAVPVGSGQPQPTPQPCPMGTAPNTMLNCYCPDNMALMGTLLCDANLQLTPCDCTNPVPVGSQPATGGATAPAGGEGGTVAPGTDADDDGGVVATGGTGGMDATGGTGGVVGDAGAAGTGGTVDAGGTGGTGGTGGAGGTRPTDGNQLAVCESAVDCNMGLDCYLQGTGAGFCTKVCAADADCDGVAGGDYTCYTTDGLCRIICQDASDTSCPSPQSCVELPAMGDFRCLYPD